MPSSGGSSEDDDVDAAVVSVAAIAAALGLAGVLAGAYVFKLRAKGEEAYGNEKSDIPNPMRKDDVGAGVWMLLVTRRDGRSGCL